MLDFKSKHVSSKSSSSTPRVSSPNTNSPRRRLTAISIASKSHLQENPDLKVLLQQHFLEYKLFLNYLTVLDHAYKRMSSEQGQFSSKTYNFFLQTFMKHYIRDFEDFNKEQMSFLMEQFGKVIDLKTHTQKFEKVFNKEVGWVTRRFESSEWPVLGTQEVQDLVEILGLEQSFTCTTSDSSGGLTPGAKTASREELYSKIPSKIKF